MLTTQDVRAWAGNRLLRHRAQLETNLLEMPTADIRARIAELKELLAALDNQAPPVWIDAE